MSNLNVNNIDVQRIINILVELKAKTEICSFLTNKSLQIITQKQNLDEIRPRLQKPSILNDLVKHFECMELFKSKHLIIKQENKDIGEKNPSDENEHPSEDQIQVDELVIEKENLQDIDGKLIAK